MIEYDVANRWNYTYRMLKDAVAAERQMKEFIMLYVTLQPLLLSPTDWARVKQIISVLEKFNEFTLLVSDGSPQITLSLAIYYDLADLLQEASDREGKFKNIDEDIVMAVKAGLKKYEKYYTFMDETDTYYVAALLDPRFKAKWLQQELTAEGSTIVINDIKAHLHSTYLPIVTMPPLVSEVPTEKRHQSLQMRMLQAIQQTSDISSDIDRYFNSDIVAMAGTAPNDDWLFNWWRGYADEYLRMAAAARDYLAIPAAEVAVEQLFSRGHDILGLRRHSMTGNTMRTLMLLKDMYSQLV